MFTIAKNTFLETIRDRILYTVVIFAVIILFGALFASEVSMNNDIKIVQDLGLSSISLFGVIITLFIGTKLLFSEIQQRTVFVIFSKPISRTRFILGKWMGLAAVLFVVTLLFTIFYVFVLYIVGGSFKPLFFEAIFFSYIEQLILIAFTFFFSSFVSSPIVALFCTFALYLAGHLMEDLYEFMIASGDTQIIQLGSFIYHITPNLEYFNLKNQVVYNVSVSFSQFFWIVLYGGLLITLLLYCSVLLFNRKEF